MRGDRGKGVVLKEYYLRTDRPARCEATYVQNTCSVSLLNIIYAEF